MEWEWLNALQSSEEFNSNLHLQIVPSERERVRAATFPIHFKSPLSEHNSIKTEILSQSIKVGGGETSVKINT